MNASSVYNKNHPAYVQDSGTFISNVNIPEHDKKSQSDRRYHQNAIQSSAVKIGTLIIEPDGYRVTKGDKDIGLTATEFEILLYLARSIGEVVSREQLYEAVWGEDSIGCDSTIMVHIRHLREKLESNPASPEYIITVRGSGYRLVDPYRK